MMIVPNTETINSNRVVQTAANDAELSAPSFVLLELILFAATQAIMKEIKTKT
jgi:hypothetical protein